VLSLLKTALKERYDVYTCPETSTLLLSNGCSYPGQSNLELLLDYELEYTKLQASIEDTFNSIAKKSSEVNGRNSIIIYDRGILDVKAYVPNDIWSEILARLNLTEGDILKRYDLVCHLVSAADGKPEFFGNATNANRSENVEEAKVLDSRTRACWSKHNNIHIFDNSTSFDMKTKKCKDVIVNSAHSFFN
jgi:hypothetical protein